MTTDAPGEDLGYFFHKESIPVLNQSRGVSVTMRGVIIYENPDLLIYVRCGQAPATVSGTGNVTRLHLSKLVRATDCANTYIKIPISTSSDPLRTTKLCQGYNDATSGGYAHHTLRSRYTLRSRSRFSG